MLKISAAAITLSFALAIANWAAAAEPKSSMKIPAGAKVEVQGKMAIISGGSGGGNGVGGTFTCNCSAQGNCSIYTSGGMLFCGKGEGLNACKGSCLLGTTTSLRKIQQ